MSKKNISRLSKFTLKKTKTINVVDPKENINQKPVDVSKLRNERSPIIIEANSPANNGSNFFDIFIYIFF